ncbi:unnamed protein product [Angiostrongylus costaricensis]|uniref:Secreted protein n=1 Tax=Angiostrongylus costaricensis TaxID=334426 RepID=A0A0R3PXI3_ANGCS|nr:unnamed protein product [Angiostrongylus costaricensis]
MQPRWLLFSSVITLVLAEEETWLSAVSAILFGPTQNNIAMNTSDLQMHPYPSVTGYQAAFHHEYPDIEDIVDSIGILVEQIRSEAQMLIVKVVMHL